MEDVISLGVGEPDFQPLGQLEKLQSIQLKKEKHSILQTRIIRIKKRNL